MRTYSFPSKELQQAIKRVGAGGEVHYTFKDDNDMGVDLVNVRVDCPSFMTVGWHCTQTECDCGLICMTEAVTAYRCACGRIWMVTHDGVRFDLPVECHGPSLVFSGHCGCGADGALKRELSEGKVRITVCRDPEEAQTLEMPSIQLEMS